MLIVRTKGESARTKLNRRKERGGVKINNFERTYFPNDPEVQVHYPLTRFSFNYSTFPCFSEEVCEKNIDFLILFFLTFSRKSVRL